MADDPPPRVPLPDGGIRRRRGDDQLTDRPAGTAGRGLWLLGLVQTAHSIEEMSARLYDFFPVATARIHQAIPAFPVVPAMSAGTFTVINMVIIAVLLGAVPFLYARREGAVALAWVAGYVEILNGIGHLGGAVLFRGYVPGAATAPLLILAGVWLIRALRGLRP